MTESVTITEALEKSGIISINPKGRSMFPYIKDTDTVVIKKPTAPLEKYDCVLFFERENVYVLHRLMRIKGDVLFTLGDNNLKYDRPVRREEIVGVLDGFYRGGKYKQVYGKKTSLRVVLGCFYPFKLIRIYFYRAVGKLKRIFGKNG